VTLIAVTAPAATVAVAVAPVPTAGLVSTNDEIVSVVCRWIGVKTGPAVLFTPGVKSTTSAEVTFVIEML
jgi:hypothetical protein